MAARLPRPLIPTARGALTVTLMLSALGALLGLVAAPEPSVAPTSPPAFSISFPSLPLARAPEPMVDEGLRAALPALDDVLPLARDLVMVAASTEPLSNGDAAGAWPEPAGAKGRLDGWGRIGGYQTLFERPRVSTGESPVLRVLADVSAFRSADGARDAMRDAQERLTKVGATASASAPLGDASAVLVQTSGSLTTHHVLVRRGSAVGLLVITGLAGGVKPELVERLAKTVVDRLG